MTLFCGCGWDFRCFNAWRFWAGYADGAHLAATDLVGLVLLEDRGHACWLFLWFWSGCCGWLLFFWLWFSFAGGEGFIFFPDFGCWRLFVLCGGQVTLLCIAIAMWS